MRSGLFSYTSDEAFISAWLPCPTSPTSPACGDPEAQWAPRQLLAYSFSHPWVFKPGTRYDYSFQARRAALDHMTGGSAAAYCLTPARTLEHVKPLP
jgi:hypothetical protein